MRRNARFRPSVTPLEDRVVPSAPAAQGRVRAAAVSPFASTRPVRGNRLLGDSVWITFHEEYVGRSRQGGIRVAFFGDSIVQNWGDAGHVAPGMLVWRDRFAPLGAVNFGLAGDATENLLWRLRDGELDGLPRVAVVQIGVNNLAEGQSPPEAAAGIAEVVRTIRRLSPPTRVLLLGLLPGEIPGSTELNDQITQVNRQIARLNNGRSVVYLDVGGPFRDAQGRPSPDLLPGGLHPAQPGYRVLAAEIEPTLRVMLSGRPIVAHQAGWRGR